MRAGAGDPREQVEAGHEAGHLRAGVVRHLPLLLRHDRVQRVHLRQPAHVHGGVEYCAGIAYQNLNAPIATQHFFSFLSMILDLSADSFPYLQSLLPNMNLIS